MLLNGQFGCRFPTSDLIHLFILIQRIVLLHMLSIVCNIYVLSTSYFFTLQYENISITNLSSFLPFLGQRVACRSETAFKCKTISISMLVQAGLVPTDEVTVFYHVTGSDPYLERVTRDHSEYISTSVKSPFKPYPVPLSDVILMEATQVEIILIYSMYKLL